MYIVNIRSIGPVDSANTTGKLVILNGLRDGNCSGVPRWTVCNKMRRIADVVIAGAMLATALPLMFLIALAIRLESPGPILDRISCVGQGGRRFPNAEVPYNGARHLIDALRAEISIIDPDGGSPSFLD